MSDKKYSVDDILDEIKTNKMSPEQIDEYSKNFQKFDTSALLDEILRGTASTNAFAVDNLTAPIVNTEREVEPIVEESVATKEEPQATPQEKMDEEEKTKTLENYIQKTKIMQTDQPLFKRETVKPKETSVPENKGKEKPKEQAKVQETPKEAPKEAPKDGYAEHKKHSTNQLKYIALQKNREKVVKDFSLKPRFMTDSMSFAKAQLENTDEDIDKAKQAELSNTAQDVDIKKVSEMTAAYSKKEMEEQASQIKKMSFSVTDNEEKPKESSVLEYNSHQSGDDCLLALRKTRNYIAVKIVAMTVLFLGTGIVSLLEGMGKNNPMQFVDTTINPLNFILINFVGLLVGVAICFDVIKAGITCIFKLNINKSTILSVATIAMIIFNFALILSPETISNASIHLYVPFLLLNFIVVLFAKRQEIKRVIKNFVFVSGEGDKYSVGMVDDLNIAEDFTKGGVNDYPFFAVNKKTRFLSNFMRESFSEDLNDKRAVVILPIIVVLAIIAGVIAFSLKRDMFEIFTVFTGVLVAGATGYSFLMVSYPLLLCCEDVSRLGGAVLSYSAVDEFCDTNAVLLNANDLFESEDVTLYGIKTFPNIVIDRAILDATSVLCETKSILSGTFLRIIEDKKEYLDAVDTVIYEDSMGISAWVNNRRVLIGSRELMKHHNIDTPSRDYEEKYLSQDKNLIYLSAGGELSAVFIVGLEGNITSRNLLVDLYNDNCLAVIKTVDPILTKAQLAKVFNMPEDAFKVISSRLHKDSEELTNSPIEESAKVCNNGNVFSFVYSLLWAKRLNKIISIGEIMNYVIIGVNILLFFAFSFINSISQLDNRFLCIYQILAVVVCVVLQKLNKVK